MSRSLCGGGVVTREVIFAMQSQVNMQYRQMDMVILSSDRLHDIEGRATQPKCFDLGKEAGKGSGGRAFSTNAAPLPGCFDCPAELSETRDVNATPNDASALPLHCPQQLSSPY
jgi:hypothetical protein